MEELEYYNINPVWGGFKKPRYAYMWKPVLDWNNQITWVKEISPIKSGYRNRNYPEDDIRHYNPLWLLDMD